MAAAAHLLKTKLTNTLKRPDFLHVKLQTPLFFSSFSNHTHSFSLLNNQSPPTPKKLPFTVSSSHGHTWQDPYHWMRNTDDPDFIHYLNQENAYAEAFMADTKSLQRVLVSEMKSRIPDKVSTPPERWGPWLYYQYIPEGKEYPVLCRRLDTVKDGRAISFLCFMKSGAGKEEILLDWNYVAQQYGYVHVGTCRVSPDHNFLAYTLDITGSEHFMLQIKDLRNGHVLPESNVDGVVSLAWAQDSRNLFYTISDEMQRPYRVCCKMIGSGDIDDVPVFTESDSSFCVDITTTKDGKFVTVNSNSRMSSEVFIIDASDPLGGLQRLRKRASGVQYFVEHHNGSFYILTNAPLNESEKWSGEDYYLARCQIEDSQMTEWQNIILPGEESSFQDMDVFNEHMVLYLNKDGSPLLCSIKLPLNINCKHSVKIQSLDPWFFPMPTNLCSVSPGSNHDYMNSVYRVVLSSPVMPDVVVDYDMSKKVFSIVHQEEVGTSSLDSAGAPGQNKERDCIEVEKWKDFSQAYCCEQKEVISRDGVKIPLTILYSRQAWCNQHSPGLLQGYGAYGEVLDKSWSADRLSLLDRGWVMAFADVRGGGGNSSWHKSGSGSHKLNSIYDFLSCAFHLVDEGYVHKDQLCAIGHSAGGLLIGAAMNMYPNLFRAAILKVPFLDICNTLLDPSLPLTMLDYEEFGNPQIQAEFQSISSYSPYDNIPQDICYPSVLVTASLNDSRVGVWEAAKWVAKVRDRTCSDCSCSVILKTNMSGGHFSEGGRYAHCEEVAYDYAFLMKVTGAVNSKS